MSTLENWVPIMHAGMDATRPGLPPQRDASPQNALYFVLFIIVGSFVVLNLFVGVVIDTFQRISDETMGGAFMDSRQRAWVSANQIMLQLRPHKRKARPESSLRRAAYAVVESAYFDGAIMLVILLNIVAMTLTYYGEPQQHTNTLAALNLCFSAIFAAEAAIKLLAYFPRQYLEDRWNRFDGLLVLGSIVDVAMQMAEGSAGEGSAAGAPQLLRSLHLPASPRISPHLPTSAHISPHPPMPGGPQLLRVIRVVRIARILRIVRSAARLRKLFYTLYLSLPSLANVGSLLFLLLFVYAVRPVPPHMSPHISPYLPHISPHFAGARHGVLRAHRHAAHRLLRPHAPRVLPRLARGDAAAAAHGERRGLEHGHARHGDPARRHARGGGARALRRLGGQGRVRRRRRGVRPLVLRLGGARRRVLPLLPGSSSSNSSGGGG